MELIIRAAYKRAYHPAGNQRQLLAMMHAEPRGKKLKSVLIPSLVIIAFTTKYTLI